MERKLAAILSADVKSYSRLMGEDEEATIRTLTAYREVLTTLIPQHRGRVVDAVGDNLLGEFASVVEAVQCAVAIQQELKARNAELPPHRRMEFRIGINLGDVIVDGERIYGDGVNIAARPVRAPRPQRGRRNRLHAGASPGRARHLAKVQLWAALHASV
jgi:adenylate cyclase